MTDSLTSLLHAETAAEDTSFLEKYLTFFLEKQLYAIPSNQVISIMGIEKITYMPKLPDYVRGIINVRGKIVPLIDLRIRFGRKAEYDDGTCIIISEVGEISVGFIVDRVNDVADIPPDRISPPPTLSRDAADRFIAGVCKLDSGVALLINGERILGGGVELTPA